MSRKLILASGSPFRKSLLINAGLTFEAIPAAIDEREIETPLVSKGVAPEEVAQALADAKALDVSRKQRGAFVIGSDQVMSMDGILFHKCANMDEARDRLIAMSGKDHFLDSAITISSGDEIVWRFVARAVMTIRPLRDAEIDQYLQNAGEGILSSVGAYQFEGLGIRLFEKIEGDYFTIIGLPMLPLLSALRDLEVIDA